MVEGCHLDPAAYDVHLPDHPPEPEPSITSRPQSSRERSGLTGRDGRRVGPRPRRIAPSGGVLASGVHELVDSLVGDAQEPGGVAHGHAEVLDELAGGLGGELLGAL